MSYLLTAYGIGIVVFAGYIAYLIGQTRAAAAELHEVESES